jgi:hypothetical protein
MFNEYQISVLIKTPDGETVGMLKTELPASPDSKELKDFSREIQELIVSKVGEKAGLWKV